MPLSSCSYQYLQAAKLAIRESIESEIRKERELRDNPSLEIVSNLYILYIYTVYIYTEYWFLTTRIFLLYYIGHGGRA